MTALGVVLVALFLAALILLIATQGKRRQMGRGAEAGLHDGAMFAYVDGGSSDCSAADAGCGGDGGGGGGGD